MTDAMEGKAGSGAAAAEAARAAGPAAAARGPLDDVVGRNPQLKKPVMRVLGAVRDAGGALDRASLEAACAEGWPRAWRQSPSVTVGILMRNRALAEQVLVDGKPYPGTLEDIQRDESVPEDARVQESLALTDSGRDLLERYAPDATLRALASERPGYADVFQAVLWACDSDGGCTRSELEAQIEQFPQLQPDGKGQTRVYPQYFLDALESAGGIVWDGAWRTTDAGRAMLAR